MNKALITPAPNKPAFPETSASMLLIRKSERTNTRTRATRKAITLYVNILRITLFHQRKCCSKRPVTGLRTSFPKNSGRWWSCLAKFVIPQRKIRFPCCLFQISGRRAPQKATMIPKIQTPRVVKYWLWNLSYQIFLRQDHYSIPEKMIPTSVIGTNILL